jgi:hypothetical protein
VTELSPQAQAIWEAFNEDEAGVFVDYGDKLAAALRAAADHVVPLSYEDLWTDGRMLQYEKRDPVREKLLAIAAELEGGND